MKKILVKGCNKCPDFDRVDDDGDVSYCSKAILTETETSFELVSYIPPDCPLPDDNTEALEQKVKELEAGLKAVEGLINESSGVYGIHLNGEDASWDSLRTGGQFEAWLSDFDSALREVTNEKETDQGL